MVPGAIICKEAIAIESRIGFVDYDMSTSNVELRSSPFRKTATGLGGNLGTNSNNDVQGLLECPVCMNLMYPPIYQVCSSYIKNQQSDKGKRY